MDYKKAYKDALERAKKLQETCDSTAVVGWMEYIFPELKESEGEEVRKSIHVYLDWLDGRKDYAPRGKYSIRDMIAWLEKQNGTSEAYELGYTEGMRVKNKEWLEKQGEQKPLSPQEAMDIAVEKCFEEQKLADKVEPKFQNGQWIVWQNKCYKVNYNGCGYELIDQNGLRTSLEYGTVDKSAHLWTIQDAKDGDVLSIDNRAFIYNGELNPLSIGAHCGIDVHNIVKFNNIGWKDASWTSNKNISPATKEQRNLLFTKMKEIGYEWDAEKKELYEQKSNGGIVREDFNEGDGFYKVELGYLNKLQVEEIERLVEAWQIPNYDRVEYCISNILADAPNDRFEDFKTNLRDCLNWVRFSKLREWNEEDEHRVKDTIYFLDTAKKHYASTVEIDACMDWFKERKRHDI